MIVGGYTLHLYCDGETDAHSYGEFPHVYFSELGVDCRVKARKAGWKLNIRDGVALCPKCSNNQPKPPQ